jgi:hypothetical protein
MGKADRLLEDGLSADEIAAAMHDGATPEQAQDSATARRSGPAEPAPKATKAPAKKAARKKG